MQSTPVAHIFELYSPIKKTIFNISQKKVAKKNFFFLLTNWSPVSLRMPTPADAKFAPRSKLFPVWVGSKYGGIGFKPKYSPAGENRLIIKIKKYIYTFSF